MLDTMNLSNSHFHCRQKLFIVEPKNWGTGRSFCGSSCGNTQKRHWPHFCVCGAFEMACPVFPYDFDGSQDYNYAAWEDTLPKALRSALIDRSATT